MDNFPLNKARRLSFLPCRPCPNKEEPGSAAPCRVARRLLHIPPPLTHSTRPSFPHRHMLPWPPHRHSNGALAWRQASLDPARPILPANSRGNRPHRV
ncbi:hypothetical protein E2C01_083349 [Portunus trituberculatus]|uniref:Uncharacterized protein n=1 Tax=Portunus trituberculatus TaxID=210409 RepID=A0A5B7J0Z3_PORTR|nr:hypothetical protein [Portunus trituberculatus]